MSKTPAITEQQRQPNYSIRAVARVCNILGLLGMAPEGVTLAEVAKVSELPKSSAFRYLATLEEHRFVERDVEDGTYRLGVAVLPLQTAEIDRLSKRARPRMESLRDELGETINFGRLDGHRVLYLEIIESRSAMRLAARPGDTDPIHSTALGKAIASQLPVERVRAILRAEGMPRMTERTLTRVGDYLEELERVRSQGYAVDDRENDDFGRCVAVPIPGDALAALSQSAPASRLPAADVPGVAETLKRAAENLVGAGSGD